MKLTKCLEIRYWEPIETSDFILHNLLQQDFQLFQHKFRKTTDLFSFFRKYVLLERLNDLKLAGVFQLLLTAVISKFTLNIHTATYFSWHFFLLRGMQSMKTNQNYTLLVAPNKTCLKNEVVWNILTDSRKC